MSLKEVENLGVGTERYAIRDNSVSAQIAAVNANIEAKFDVRYSKTRAQYNNDTIYVFYCCNLTKPFMVYSKYSPIYCVLVYCKE